MTIRKKLSAAMPFAQLFGISPRAEEEDDDKEKSKRARRAEEDDKEKDEEEDDKKGRKAKRAEDDDDNKEDEDDKKSRRAKGESEDDKEDDGKKGRKAKRAEDDDEDMEDDEDDEDKKDAKSKKAIVAQERARCARILAHGLKTSNPEQACVFAFDTNMSADAAISALSVARSVGARVGSLGERMKDANVTHAGASGGEDSSGVSPIAQKIIAAAARASR